MVRRRAGEAGSDGVEERIGRAIGDLYRWLEGNRFTRSPWEVIQTFSKAQGALLSGSMAYYTFLSLVPLLMVAAFTVGVLAQMSVDVRDELAAAIERIAPEAKGAELLEQLARARVALGVLGMGTLIYAASGFVGAVTACLNRMWDIDTGRNPVGQKLVNLLVVCALCVVLLGSVGVTLWVVYLAEDEFGAEARAWTTLIEQLASPLSLMIVLLFLYRTLPAQRLSWRSQLPGAAFAVFGIELFKRGFTYWAQHSAGFAVLPRSMLSVVVLLVWFGLVGQMILYGAAVNVVRQRRAMMRSSLDADTTETARPT